MPNLPQDRQASSLDFLTEVQVQAGAAVLIAWLEDEAPTGDGSIATLIRDMCREGMRVAGAGGQG